MGERVTILHGDCRTLLPTLPAASVQCCVTSPPRNQGRFVKGMHWRPRKPHWDKAWLEREYQTNRRSAADIAGEAGCTENNILFWLGKHDIRRRTIAETRATKHWGQSGAANPMFGRKGADNPRYVDGSAPERQRLYVQSEGRAFLQTVYRRDGFRCVRCGEPNKGPRTLHAHHLKSWAGNVSLRFDQANVVTLCRNCHHWVHSKANVAREYLG